MAQELKIFDNPNFGEIRTIINEDGKLFFVASDVAKALGYAVPQKAVIDHCKHCSKMEHPTNKGTYINIIPESDVYRLTMKSKLPNAEQFQDWVCEDVLTSISKTGQYSVQNPKVKQLSIRDELFWIEKSKKILNLNDTSVLKMLQQIAAPYGLPVPDYTPSKGILKSATELLKERGYSISAQVFNQRAIEKGFLCELTRNSSGGKKKKFKSITEKGKPYGENQVNPNNPKETQPLWYEDKFDELLVKLGFAEGRASV